VVLADGCVVVVRVGCTVGSTVVNHQQQRETRDWQTTPAANGNTTSEARCRPKQQQQQQQQQHAWSAAARTRSATDQSVFRIYKGIKCFDFCKSHNVVATGGKLA